MILQKSEDTLQRLIHNLNRMCGTYDSKISVKKAKVVVFRKKFSIRNSLQNIRTNNIVVVDKILELFLVLSVLRSVCFLVVS